MEEVNKQLESQSEQGIESNQAQAISNEPMAGVNNKTNEYSITGSTIVFKEKPTSSDCLIQEFPIEKIITDEEEYRNATEEEKIVHCATQMMLQVIAKAPKPLTSEEQSLMFERTVRQVRSERANLFHKLDEAEKELSQLKWNNIQPQSLTQSNHVRVSGRRTVVTQKSVGGFRGLYIITFGNFVLAKQNKWIYCPTKDQMLKLINRFQQKKYCENYANSLRAKYKSTVTGAGRDAVEVENEAFKEFKKDLLDQINELRVTV